MVLLVTEVTDWICAGGGELSNDGVSLGNTKEKQRDMAKRKGLDLRREQRSGRRRGKRKGWLEEKILFQVIFFSKGSDFVQIIPKTRVTKHMNKERIAETKLIPINPHY